MNRPLTAAFVAAAMLVATPAMAASRTWTIEADKHSPNEAAFTSKAAIVKFTGRTDKVIGTAQIDANDVAKSVGNVVVDLTTLDTGINMRNDHMRATIEAEKFPTATYKFTGIKVPGNKLVANQPVNGTATGTLTLHGVTKPFAAPIELTFLPQGDANYRAGDWVHVSSTFKLKITDYGITLPASVLGVKVADEQEISFDGMAKAK